MNKFLVGSVTKMWITSFWTQIWHLNFKENVEKMLGNIYSTSEHHYHVGGQQYALQHGSQ